MTALTCAALLGVGAAWAAPSPSLELGSALRQEGFVVHPPAGFRMGRMDLFAGTRAGAVALEPERRRFLTAALFDGEGDDAASMLVAVVEESLPANPGAREEFSAAVVRHYAEELALPFSLQRAELLEGDASRVEVVGTVKEGGQLRYVLVAGMAGEGKHAVITFSMPSGKFDALLPQLRASLDSYRMSDAAAPSSGPPRGVLGALAGALGGALLVSVMLRRARRLRRAQASGEG